MKEIKEQTADFDLSKLSLSELIKVYENIEAFLKFLQENKAQIVGDDKDE